ncbi:MAG: alpha/beta hydrolase [Bacteroidota bacterium]
MGTTKKWSLRAKIRAVWFGLVLCFMGWQWSTYQAKGVTSDLLDSNAVIQVTNNQDFIRFEHQELIEFEVFFYPGGMVDPKAYVPLCRNLAEAGYNVTIIKMPWRLSTKGYKKIKDLAELEHPAKKYILAGHSQGAKMAAQFVFEHPDLMDGLILLGTSHPRDISLSDRFIPCLKLYAEKDGLASPAEVFENEKKLPQGYQLIMIKGGNHSQFGNMGRLLMDGKADINPALQQDIMLREILGFLRSI